MSEFRLIQISDPHLTQRHAALTENFHRLSDHIAAKKPDLVIDSGDMAFDAPTRPRDLEFAKSLHAALPVECRYLPGNHDVGDNPTAIGPKPSHPVNDERLESYRAVFGDDRWRFEAAGWCFIGLNSLVMNTGLAREAEQFDWLASQLATPERGRGEQDRQAETDEIADHPKPNTGVLIAGGDFGLIVQMYVTHAALPSR